jgi:small subunit ribosomal protein S21
MAIVTVNQGESIESALRRFKRKVMTEEIIKDAKKHAFFIPPGQKAKLKSALARKRNKKKGRMRVPSRLVISCTTSGRRLISPVVFNQLPIGRS